MSDDHTVPKGFWPQIDHQLERIRAEQPATFTDVRAILLDPAYTSIVSEVNRNGARQFGDDAAFFAGSGGDATLRSALYSAGWRTVWAEASYYYAMWHYVTGETLSYIEGDVLRGDLSRPNPAVHRNPAVQGGQMSTYIELGGRRYSVTFVFGRYVDGHAVAITAVDSSTGEKVTSVTVNIAHYIPRSGCVMIKDYAENDGLARQLVELGFIEPTGTVIPSGWVTIGEYRLLGEWKLAAALAL